MSVAMLLKSQAVWAETTSMQFVGMFVIVASRAYCMNMGGIGCCAESQPQASKDASS